MTVRVVAHLVDGKVSEVIDCKFIRENKCDVLLRYLRSYPFCDGMYLCFLSVPK